MENECQLQIRDFNSLSEGMSSILWLEIHIRFIMGCPLILPACMQRTDPVPTLPLDVEGSSQIDRFLDGKLIGSICCFPAFLILSKDLTSCQDRLKTDSEGSPGLQWAAPHVADLSNVTHSNTHPTTPSTAGLGSPLCCTMP